MKIKDIMTKDIVSSDIDSSIKDAALLMLNYDIGFLPIKKGNKIVGCLTDRDLVIYGIANDNKELSNSMKNTLITIDENENVLKAIEIMKNFKIRRLLVKNGKKLTGIISLSDIISKYDKNKDIIEMLKCIFSIDKNANTSDLKVNDFEL